MAPPSNYAPVDADILQGLNVIRDEDINQFLNIEEEEDLNVFRNHNFFDFDTGVNADFTHVPPKPDVTGADAASASTSTSTVIPDLGTTTSPVEFDPSMFPSLGFDDFQTFQAPTAAYSANVHPNLPNIQPNPAQEYTSATLEPSPEQNDLQHGHSKSKSASLSRPITDDEAAQRAVEDDKRRRNTAASARFRVKKKQREQALEQKTKALEDQITSFRGRIQELETENKWLKSLVLEKNESKPDVVSVLKSMHQSATSTNGNSNPKPDI